MNDLPYLLTALCAAVISGYKFQALLRAPREVRRTIRPVCFGGFCVFVQFIFISPSVADHVNELLGLPGLSRLIVYAFGIGLVCSAQVLVLNWRFDRSRAQRVVRPVLVASCVIVVVMCALFSLGSADEEALRGFPFAFARSPYLGALLVIYFCSYAAGVGSAVYQGWRGAREVPEDKVWLRRAVLMTAVGMVFPVVYAVLSLVAVVAAWFGEDMGYLAVKVAPGLVMLGVPWFLVAITITAWGSRFSLLRLGIADWRSKVRDYVALGPLWRTLRAVNPDMTHAPRRLSERLSIEFRLFWRVVEINDWLEQLQRFDHPELDGAAPTQVRVRGLPAEQVTRINAALRAQEQAQGDDRVPAGEVNPAPENKFVFAAERARLVSVAKALDPVGGP